jgi:hypothetical protein
MLLECVQRNIAPLFTVCALTNCSTDFNSAVMWRCTLSEKHVILKVLLKMLGLHSVIIPRRYVKRGKADWCWRTNCALISLTDRERERERAICDLWLQDCYERRLSFHRNCICFSGCILVASNWKGKCQLFMIQRNSCRYCCNTATHTINIVVYVPQKWKL